ncbi:MAG: hypothetical protein AW07_04146 [Candidatus Accumulibacter sp. SK-11]|nr:MAG: hypothetical protein AW07_04146 [Candidatus Accumulibacter sp. SK-11]
MRKSASWGFGQNIRTVKAKNRALQESGLYAGRSQDYRNVMYRSAFCWARPFKLCHSIRQEKQP